MVISGCREPRPCRSEKRIDMPSSISRRRLRRRRTMRRSMRRARDRLADPAASAAAAARSPASSPAPAAQNPRPGNRSSAVASAARPAPPRACGAAPRGRRRKARRSLPRSLASAAISSPKRLLGGVVGDDGERLGEVGVVAVAGGDDHALCGLGQQFAGAALLDHGEFGRHPGLERKAAQQGLAEGVDRRDLDAARACREPARTAGARGRSAPRPANCPVSS